VSANPPTKKAEQLPARGMNRAKGRDPTGLYARASGTASANGGWFSNYVRHQK